MSEPLIPGDLRRFLQSSAVTIPHIETVLLLRRAPSVAWSRSQVARRLYVSDAVAGELLSHAQTIGIVAPSEGEPVSYYYRPSTPELARLMDQLDLVYSKHLLAVTKLVHAARDTTAEAFANAFRFRREDR